MASPLTAGERADLCTPGCSGDLVFPPPTPLVPIAQQVTLQNCPCWSWALTGGVLGNAAPTSAPSLYEFNSPVDPFTDIARAALPQGNIPAAIWGARSAALQLAWGNSLNEAGPPYPNRLSFMEEMMRVACEANGLVVAAAGGTNYTIHMTAPADDWYHWQHWSVGVSVGGPVYHVQTEPNIDIHCGENRIWEANRAGHLEAQVNIVALHPLHDHAITTFLDTRRCVACAAMKPSQTGAFNRWHRCSSALCARVWCGPCGAALVRAAYFSRERTCDVCASPTELIDDV